MINLNKFITPEEAPQPANMGNNLLPLLMQYLSQQGGQQGMPSPEQTPAHQGGMPGEELEPRQAQLGQGNMMPQGGGVQSWGELKKLAEATFPGNPTLQKVALAQIGLESRGPENLSQLGKQNGLFGIKGKGANMQTTEYVNGQPVKMAQGFQTSNSPLEAFMKYKELLSKPRYADVLVAQTPEQGFEALKAGGWATDPAYVKKLSSVFNSRIKPLFEDET